MIIDVLNIANEIIILNFKSSNNHYTFEIRFLSKVQKNIILTTRQKNHLKIQI